MYKAPLSIRNYKKESSERLRESKVARHIKQVCDSEVLDFTDVLVGSCLLSLKSPYLPRYRIMIMVSRQS